MSDLGPYKIKNPSRTSKLIYFLQIIHSFIYLISIIIDSCKWPLLFLVSAHDDVCRTIDVIWNQSSVAALLFLLPSLDVASKSTVLPPPASFSLFLYFLNRISLSLLSVSSSHSFRCLPCFRSMVFLGSCFSTSTNVFCVSAFASLSLSFIFISPSLIFSPPSLGLVSL